MVPSATGQGHQTSQLPQTGFDGSYAILSDTIINFIQQSDGDTVYFGVLKTVDEAMEHVMGPDVKLPKLRTVPVLSPRCRVSALSLPSVKAKPSSASPFPNILPSSQSK